VTNVVKIDLYFAKVIIYKVAYFLRHRI